MQTVERDRAKLTMAHSTTKSFILTPFIFALFTLTLFSCTDTKPNRATSAPIITNISDTPVTNIADSATSTAWTVTAVGIGPIRAGMTVAQARTALGGDLMMIGSAPSCGYASSHRAPAGVNFMIVDGRIARIDVRGGTVATNAGAKIGDTEQRVSALYPGRLAVTPHKYYAKGHYLTVTPSNPADSAHRIVFETDSSRVTAYRSGLLPSVEWVEGCS